LTNRWRRIVWWLCLRAFSERWLLLASLGLYGMTAYAVARRRGEIGVRMALGAQTAGIVRLVLSRVVFLVSVGVLVGVGAICGRRDLLRRC